MECFLISLHAALVLEILMLWACFTKTRLNRQFALSNHFMPASNLTFLLGQKCNDSFILGILMK